MNVAQETLGFRRAGFSPCFIATHVSIRTSDTSSNPHHSPSQAYGTLSYHPTLITAPPLRSQSAGAHLLTERIARPLRFASRLNQVRNPSFGA